jgi:K+-sensing histidine kinase KdpD
LKQLKNLPSPVFTSRFSQYLIVLLVIGLIAILCQPLANQEGYHIVSFILLFAVSVIAVFMGIGPVLIASTVSSLVWNYFFIPPYFTFHIARTEDKFMFGSFFIIALLNGVLTNRIRRQERLVREREERTNALFQLTGELSKANGIDKVLEVARSDFKKYFNADSFIILQDGNNKLETTDRLVNEKKRTDIDINLAEWAFNNSRKAGRFTDTFKDADLTYYPLTGTRLNPGVIAINLDTSVYKETDAFWDTYFAQISNALEREFLGEFALKARILDESDKLYKTLFNLISHEFRIPIATIIGASDTLLLAENSDKYREELLHEIFKASARLNHLIENLLNMSRLESGKMSVRLDWCDITDLVNKVTQNLTQELEQFQFETVIPPEMPLIKLDFGLMEQVLYNLLLNSCQYSPASTVIRLEASYSNGFLVLQVADKGPGFPSETLSKVFDKFFKVDDSKTGGLGLGLSIVKGLIEAHKGTVQVENLHEGGAGFTLIIPSEIPDMQKIRSEE